jgi:hypothetical protein
MHSILEREYKMARMWVKPKGRSAVLVDEEQAEMIIKQNYELRNPKKEVKKKVIKKKVKEEIKDGNN